jgi:hypothetical protein
VGPGVSTFYLDDTDTAVTAFTTFFTSIKSMFPPGITWTIPSEVDTMNATTGVLTGADTLTGGGTVTSSGTDTRFAAGVGARVVWNTTSVVNGRRVRGSTFLVPLENYCYASDGTLDATNMSTLQSAATALAGSGIPLIWHRPTGGLANGSTHAVTSGTVPDKVSTLRTRRT